MTSTINYAEVRFTDDSEARVEFQNGMALVGRLREVAQCAGWGMTNTITFIRGSDGLLYGPVNIHTED